MSVAKIARRFEALGKVPINIKDVIHAVNELLFDEYVCVHAIAMNPGAVQGICYQSRPKIMDGSAIRPMNEHRVIYNSNLPVDSQRLIVCKELIHVLDPESMRTKTRDGVVHLIEKIRSKTKSIDTGSPDDLRVMIDKFAEWQAVAILFPFGYWEEAFALFKQNKLTIDKIAAVLQIPAAHVAATMTDDWRYMRETFLFE